MIFNEITLYNFGSYEGLNIIKTIISKEKNIILFGGKNGAGKTTLFNSIGICLYGPVCLGCSSLGNKYFNKIKSFINNKALMSGEKIAYVQINMSLENGRELDTYTLIRKWEISKSITEEFTVIKNDNKLDEQQVADFEKYIFSLIPPELFNLYFFDGEKITDFFTDEDGNKKFKQAFLTLCGYDTFEIMLKNFKRNSSNSERNNAAYKKYNELKERTNFINEEIKICKEIQEDIFESISECDAEIKKLDDNFYKSGGITNEEIKKLEMQIKNEEQKREEWNYSLKKWANDVIPFLMVSEQIDGVKEQITNESKKTKVENFIEVINSKTISKYLSKINHDENIKDNIIKIALEQMNVAGEMLFDLSYEQILNINSLIRSIQVFELENIFQYKDNIKSSIALTTKIKKKLDKLSSAEANDYLKSKDKLLKKKDELLNNKVSNETKLNNLVLELNTIEPDFLKNKEMLETSIKKESINDISIKAILMLENLQQKLYESQISKLIKNFKSNSSMLFNKKDLISDISIDNDFKIHVYQNVSISARKLSYVIKNKDNNFDYIISEKTLKEIQKNAKNNESDICKILNSFGNSSIDVPVEINFERLSAGERQMFVMSLYLSLVQLGNIQIPFIIDTPFARIDLEHRNNITKYFFRNLSGQVFILSTNKEIDENHIEIIKDKISKMITLRNLNKSKTEIVNNNYFGETYDI